MQYRNIGNGRICSSYYLRNACSLAHKQVRFIGFKIVIAKESPILLVGYRTSFLSMSFCLCFFAGTLQNPCNVITEAL